MSPEKRKRVESHKKKTQPIKQAQRGFSWGCLLFLLVPATLVIGVLIVLLEPTRFNLHRSDDMAATAQHIGQTEAVVATQAMANAETHIALELWRGDLAHDATQAALNESATQTAISIANAQQATRVAFDFSATQTQVDLDYLGTRAALGLDATAISLGLTPGSLPYVDFTPMPTPTRAFPPLELAIPLFEDRFEHGLSGGLWQYSIDDWTLNEEGMLTTCCGASWLLTQSTAFTDYALEIDLLVGIEFGAAYFVFLHIPQADDASPGYGLRLTHDGERFTAIGLYQFPRDQLAIDVDFPGDNLTEIAAVQMTLLPSEKLRLQVSVREGQVVVWINDQQVFDGWSGGLLSPGAIGLHVPLGTRIERIAMYP